MNKKITKALAVTTLSTALVFGGAATAQAADFYVPGTNIAVTASKTAARTYVVTVKGGVFAAGRTVTIKIPKILSARFGDVTSDDGVSWTTVANAAGGVDPFEVSLPDDVAGTFNLTAETDDGVAVSSTFSVSDLGVPSVVANTAGGIDGAMVGLWVGAAAAVLAGGALMVGGAGRSRGQHLSI